MMYDLGAEETFPHVSHLQEAKAVIYKEADASFETPALTIREKDIAPDAFTAKGAQEYEAQELDEIALHAGRLRKSATRLNQAFDRVSTVIENEHLRRQSSSAGRRSVDFIRREQECESSSRSRSKRPQAKAADGWPRPSESSRSVGGVDVDTREEEKPQGKAGDAAHPSNPIAQSQADPADPPPPNANIPDGNVVKLRYTMSDLGVGFDGLTAFGRQARVSGART